MKNIFALAALALALAAAAPAYADGQALLVCRTAEGGRVTMLATGSKDKVDLVMDEAGKVNGVSEARGLNGTFESADAGSTNGPIDLLEVGKGFYGEDGDCGFGLQFNTDNQRLGKNRDIPLKPGSGYNVLECKGGRQQIESCQLAEGLGTINELKKHVRIEVAD